MLVNSLRKLRVYLQGSRLESLLKLLRINRIIRRIYEQRILSKGHHSAKLLNNDLKFAVSSSREITRIDSFVAESDFVRRILDHTRANDTFYDVGANIGVVSLILAKSMAQSGLTVHAFEPEPENASHLRHNIQLNQINNITVHETALGATSGTAQLYIEGTVGGGSNSLVSGHISSNNAIDTHIMTGHDFAQINNSYPDIIKIDVEGYESEVIQGMQSLFEKKQIRDLFLEMHPKTMSIVGSSPPQLQSWIESHDYRLVWSQQRGHECQYHFQR